MLVAISYLALTVAVMGVVMLLLRPSRTTSIVVSDAARMARLERKLDLVLGHLGVAYAEPTSPGLSEEARRVALEGNVIQAIKIVREETGLGLRDAKDLVDAFLRSARQ